jgi:hypothetical protein
VLAQWVDLGPGGLLVASADRAWIQSPQPGAFGLDRPMPPSLEATPETTGRLLDGAIAAAERGTPPPAAPPMTAVRWAWDLVNQWYIAHHSVGLLGDSVARYRGVDRPDLAAFAATRLEGEQGHNRFPLDDLRALGYEAERAVAAVAPDPVAVSLIAFARDALAAAEPVGFLGYIHAMERHAIRVPSDWFTTLNGILPPGVDATSGLRAHATDLDLEHVSEAVAFFATLPPRDRAEIARACFRTAQIRCASPGHPSEEQLAAMLSPFSVSPAPSARRGDHQQQGALR